VRRAGRGVAACLDLPLGELELADAVRLPIRTMLPDVSNGMADDPRNEHVLVIGAGPGIGAAVARRAAASGARVTVAARSESTLAPLLAQLHDTGADAHGVLVDAAYEPAFSSALAQVVAERGAPTLAVYNAVDATPDGAPTAVEPEFLTVSLETNVTGALVLVQGVLDPMRAAGGGTILLTGGVLATRPWADKSVLSVGKAALRSLALCLHQEIGTQDPVNVVTLTVGGHVRPGGAFDPDDIADRMWHAHQSRETGDGGELTYAGPRDRAPRVGSASTA
jgi:NAD(P)-dependent dehydrogenase (short-subunit alcohol dehydrogenase family)